MLLCKIIDNVEITRDGYLMSILDDELALKCEAGQFLNIAVPNRPDLILRRPISICDVDASSGIIKLFYLVVGEGTKELKKLKLGDMIDVLGPLGNGFDLKASGKVLLVGGGCGVAPLLFVARKHRDNGVEFASLLGFRDIPYLKHEFESFGRLEIATETGIDGYKGRVDELLKYEISRGDVTKILSCGPEPMLKAVKAIGELNGIETLLSLEERMACGIGACLVCACKAKVNKGHTFKKVCKDGPVFKSDEVIFDD